LAVVAVAGCSGGGGSASEDVGQMTALASQFARATATVGRPKNEQEFKQYLDKNASHLIERLQLSSMDDLFVSQRDGERYVVLYGPKPKEGDPEVVAYEKTGVDGKRQVGFLLGTVKTVDEAEFKKLVPNPPAAAPAS
jgi:hypothetical protein